VIAGGAQHHLGETVGWLAPISGTRAHHLVQWADLGPSDLTNAALLCERHHTTVHTRRLAGRVVRGAFGERVEWDLTRGSYEELLARGRPPSRAEPA
jgi:hypothetical protein